jgi:tRNA pseudouridine32 synthase/23S rRNA pseudouridine746 synthase
MEKFSLKKSAGSHDPKTACDFLAAQTGLSKSRIKDAMAKGAVWIKKKKRGARRRLRRATTLLNPGDFLELYYDEKLLALKPPQSECVKDLSRYSVWYKPAGLMTQGTMYGDHCSLLRQAEIFFGPSGNVFLVHRLDREASGLVLIAHDSGAAAKLSELFRKNQIIKRYRVEVLGNLAQETHHGTITLPLDNNPAITEFEVGEYDPNRNISTATVIIKTGRLHQIRRHFDMIGFPLMGDPRYGKGNKTSDGMKLSAERLEFRCPFTLTQMVFEL